MGKEAVKEVAKEVEKGGGGEGGKQAAQSVGGNLWEVICGRQSMGGNLRRQSEEVI